MWEEPKNIRDHSIFTLDLQGRIISWNLEAERILGFSEAEALGQHFSIIFSLEDKLAGIPDHELQVASSEGRAEDERWHIRKRGEQFWALGIVTPTQDSKGKHTGFSKILRDMTDRKRAEEALQLADRRKAEFLAMLANELRNPLTPIRSGLELLALNGVDDETVGIMREQVDHLVRLVDDLLDVSRITRGKISLQKEIVDLVPILKRCIEFTSQPIKSHRHSLTVSLPPEPVWVEVDPVRISQVVMNLLSNAAKYTLDGGKLSLMLIQNVDEASISVRDNGIGLDEEMLPRVFELFTQADQSLERSEGGLGIGLTLVKVLTEINGGRIAVTSEGIGHGSEFTVTLPIVLNHQPDPKLAESTMTSESRKILLVDDNIDSTVIQARLLTKLGNHLVKTAHDGKRAIELAMEFQPDLILLDIGLPLMNGFEVARQLRSLPQFEKTFLVALTGYGTGEDRRKSTEAGFDLHLVKPPALQTLKDVLNRHPLK